MNRFEDVVYLRIADLPQIQAALAAWWEVGARPLRSIDFAWPGDWYERAAKTVLADEAGMGLRYSRILSPSPAQEPADYDNQP